MPSLIAILGLDASGFKGGLESARLHADRMGNRIGNGLSSRIAGALSAAAVGAAVKHTVDWAGKLQDVSDALGVNVEWLQKMQNGAATAGGKIEDLEKSLVALNQAREDALRNPKGQNAQAFGRMGFSQSDVASLPAQQFYDRMVALFKDGGSAQLENDVIQVGGKSAKNLLAAFYNQFKSDVPLVSAEIISQLDDLGDKFTILGQSMTAGLAPAIVTVLGWVQTFVNKVKEIGSFFGGAVEGFIQGAQKSKKGGLGAVGDAVIGAVDGAGQAASEEEQRQKAEAAASAAAISKAAELRKNRNNAAPFRLDDFIATEKDAKSARGHGGDIKLNSLQSVGGYAQSPVGSLVEEAKKTNQKLDKLVEVTEGIQVEGGKPETYY